MGVRKYWNGFDLALHPETLQDPLKWKSPRRVFVNSMSDLLHEDVPLSFIGRVFETMSKANQHQFQVLTKRSSRLAQIAPLLPWPVNIWMGVTIEDQDNLDRLEALVGTPAHVKFLSLEPLLGPLPNLVLSGIDWVIVGGESGPGAREMKEEWVLDIKNQCASAGVEFFFKQWGGPIRKHTGRRLLGRTWDGMPSIAQV